MNWVSLIDWTVRVAFTIANGADEVKFHDNFYGLAARIFSYPIILTNICHYFVNNSIVSSSLASFFFMLYGFADFNISSLKAFPNAGINS